MTPSALLARYDAELRGEAEVLGAATVARLGPLLAATFDRGTGFVTYAPLPADADVAALVDAAVAHFTADPAVEQVEWKTRGHDRLPGLAEALSAHGFAWEDEETVMAGDIDAVIAAAAPVPDGYTLERCASEAALREASALAGRVFGDPSARTARRAGELVAQWRQNPGGFEVWLVRDAHGSAVSSGRIEFVPGTDWAGLWGGVCDEHHRGRGLYRALTAARATSAQRRGTRYIQSDCTEFSRPILERAGLVAITTTTPAIWTRTRLETPSLPG